MKTVIVVVFYAIWSFRLYIHAIHFLLKAIMISPEWGVNEQHTKAVEMILRLMIPRVLYTVRMEDGIQLEREGEGKNCPSVQYQEAVGLSQIPFDKRILGTGAFCLTAECMMHYYFILSPVFFSPILFFSDCQSIRNSMCPR